MIIHSAGLVSEYSTAHHGYHRNFEFLSNSHKNRFFFLQLRPQKSIHKHLPFCFFHHSAKCRLLKGENENERKSRWFSQYLQMDGPYCKISKTNWVHWVEFSRSWRFFKAFKILFIWNLWKLKWIHFDGALIDCISQMM